MEGKQLSLGDVIKDYVDEHSNTWYLDGNAVYLKLAAEPSSRKIGTINGNKFATTRDRNKHLFRKANAYGFNLDIIRGVAAEYVDLSEQGGFYRIPLSVISEKGEILFFKQQGFEKQYFLSLDIIEQYKTISEVDEKRIRLIGESWYKRLKPEFEKEYMQKLGAFTAQERAYKAIYPKAENVFKAYKVCPFEETRVVILGQDPYHTPDVADGLAFSSGVNTYLPPSLLKIYKQVEREIGFGLFLDQDPNLKYWAEQGILLANAVLTVEQGRPASHAGMGWEEFTKAALIELKTHYRDLVILLWGAKAKSYKQYIDNDRHLILEAEHPAFAARENREWLNGDCFSKTNDFLNKKGYGSIQW